jgi:hypothetical protein
MATRTAAKSRFTACAITCDVEWRRVASGEGSQSKSPVSLR